MQVLQTNHTMIENNKVISKHSFRPLLKASWKNTNKEDEVLSVEQMRTPEEQEVCCMATD